MNIDNLLRGLQKQKSTQQPLNIDGLVEELTMMHSRLKTLKTHYHRNGELIKRSEYQQEYDDLRKFLEECLYYATRK